MGWSRYHGAGERPCRRAAGQAARAKSSIKVLGIVQRQQWQDIANQGDQRPRPPAICQEEIKLRFVAPAARGIEPVKRCCHGQPKEQTIAPTAPRSWGPDQSQRTDDMRSGPDQRPRARFNGNRPFRQQPRVPQNNQTFDSNGPNVKIRGSAYQIFERYLALAREATAGGDRIAAENFYQHAEHYFRINNARRDGNQQGPAPRPSTPADVERNSSEPEPREVEVDRFQPQWDGDDPASSETSTH